MINLHRGTHDFQMIKIREGKGGGSIQNRTSAVDGAQKRRFERILNCNFRDHKFLRNSKVPQGAPKVRPRCAQGAPKVPQGALWCAQGAPKVPPGATLAILKFTQFFKINLKIAIINSQIPCILGCGSITQN